MNICDMICKTEDEFNVAWEDIDYGELVWATAEDIGSDHEPFLVVKCHESGGNDMIMDIENDCNCYDDIHMYSYSRKEN